MILSEIQKKGEVVLDNHMPGSQMKKWSERLSRDILPLLPQRIATVLGKIDPAKLESLEEIRLRAGKPLVLQNYRCEWFVEEDGTIKHTPGKSFIVEQQDIQKALEIMSDNSIYAYQDEIRNGYLTLRGGHRVGLTGKIVMEGGSVRNIKDISSLNIRLSGEVPGCSEKLLKHLFSRDGNINNTLIISPPQCGKTTILRDITRVLSNGLHESVFKGVKVGLVDERSEIAACFKGIPQNDVGIRTDVLDGCPKTIGMDMLIRSMSPKVIITDEIGNDGDRDAIRRVLNAGVKIITSAHGYNISDLKSRQEVIALIEEKVFDKLIVLGNLNGPGTIVEVVEGKSVKIQEGVKNG